jgi:hypothetical protein
MMLVNLWKISFFIALSLLLAHAVYGKVESAITTSLLKGDLHTRLLTAPWLLLQRLQVQVQ